ncbi:MAG TPA: phosphomannomutase/phosphoglucomutase [Lentimicrobium sp.]|nr:phosphomannomutase/phosphoglucomutase [Lentimicrobium sp.]
MRKAFKAYDIRGIFGVDFNETDVYRIGFFLPGLLKTSKVLIGMDVRLSSKTICENLCRGITDAGCDVDLCGYSTTPMIYWATARYGYQASVMITASHNPAKYNGLKISRREALPVGYDTGLRDLMHLAEAGENSPVKNKGIINQFEFKADYLAFLKPYIPDLSNFKIAVDCSNGMGSLLIRDLLGNSPVYLYDTPDGTFPNHEPNPLEQENVRDLSQVVVDESCDAGLIFDGDADRVMFVDEKGTFIQPDIMIAILADYYASKGLTGKCLQDIRTSKSVTEYVESRGFKMHTWRVGRAYAALKLREIGGLFGGELAGHYYFKDFYYSDSAYLAALILLGEIKNAKENGLKFSDMVNRIKVYHGSGEINLHIDDKAKAMKTVINEMKACEKALKVMDFDGYRIEFTDWWFNIRPSNTEPYLRLIVEARTKEMLDNRLEKILSILEPFKVPYAQGH